MGQLFYDDSRTPITIDDVVLAHLKIVIVAKLRRRESFTLTWQHAAEDTPGRSTILLSPAIPLRFVFDEPVGPVLDPEWIKALTDTVNATGGIQLSDGTVVSNG